MLQPRNGQTVVLGTGCFDIMHVGHLYFLEQCRQQGDLLVVGLNSDLSVRTMKGPNRPIVPEDGRAKLVAALRVVDYVFVDDAITAEEHIRVLRPDVYAIGTESVGGYPTEMAAANEVGARLHIVDRLPVFSTSSIVSTIQSHENVDSAGNPCRTQ